MKKWPTKRLADACEVFADGDWVESKDQSAEGIRLVQTGNVGEGLFKDREEKARYISIETFKRLRCTEIIKGDCLISRLPDPVGRSCILPQTGERMITAVDCTIVCFNPNYLIPEFFNFYSRSPEYLQAVEAETTGTTRKRISRSRLGQIKIPVPPIPEQKRIVRLLDEADELRKLRTTADERTAALVPALFNKMFGEKLGQTVPRVKLGQVAEVVSGVAKGRKFNGRQPIEVPYLRVANVQAGYLDLSEIKTIQALPGEIGELALRKGDVLLTEGGDFDKLGRGAMLEQDLPNCIHQNHVFRVRVDQSELEPLYFAKFLLTTEAKAYFLSCAKRTTNLASINMTQLRALPVPLRALALQKECAERVVEIREMEAEQSASRQHLDDLFHSMLHLAFTGEL
jgi:type I restriction enzyme, S subunit